MALPIVTDLTAPPIVGHFYLVPCIHYWWHGQFRWWPVIGPKHEDAEHLNFEATHYHLDRRFLPARCFSRDQSPVDRASVRLGKRMWRSADTDLAAAPLSEFGHGAARNPNNSGPEDPGGPLPLPVLRKRRCIVADVGFPDARPVNPAWRVFHAAYLGRKCRRDGEGHLICPHKGARLGSLAPDRNGLVICPLHGLMIDVVNGHVVKRPEIAQAPLGITGRTL